MDMILYCIVYNIVYISMYNYSINDYQINVLLSDTLNSNLSSWTNFNRFSEEN